ncbi:NAD(P)/FAD-dependent oxidoreductase [Chitinophaga sancti]|uniref:NAD(P)/FAD-dependent oxidoreductase n=1 Tax=Chitinophaga sancti TaxID=1004 RepID=UPI003F7A419E
MLSYWEKQALLQYDYIIAGSGIVGLSTAISLREAQPDARVLVLEKGVLPTGASTKNAGFACIGSLTELLADLKVMSAEEVLALVALRWKGLQALRHRLGDQHIDYRENGSYELIGEQELYALSEIDGMNELMRGLLGGKAFSLAKNEFGFNDRYVKALIRNNFEGELHTGKMMRRLIDLALYYGVEIKTGCEIGHFIENDNSIRVSVGEYAFEARQLGICTNAFTKNLIPDLDLQPGRGQVLITDPIPELPFKGIYHMDEGYYYFRELEGRVLFGGGRNMDFKGEATTNFELNPNIHKELENRLRHIILPGFSFNIADRWTGIMAFGQNRQPVIRRHSARIALGVRMGGMGVAIGTAIGAQLADILLKNDHD